MYLLRTAYQQRNYVHVFGMEIYLPSIASYDAALCRTFYDLQTITESFPIWDQSLPLRVYLVRKLTSNIILYRNDPVPLTYMYSITL